MTARRRLPHRRRSETFNVECSGLHYTVTASWFDSGELGEIWVQNGKIDSAADAYVRDASVLASIALQRGATLDEIRKSLMRDARGNPSSPLGAALDFLTDEETAP
jgi:hypothetical protein